MSDLRLEYLLNCYVKDECSRYEEEELMAILADPENEGLIKDIIERTIQNPVCEKLLSDNSATNIIERILNDGSELVIPEKKNKVFFSFRTQLAASVLILLVSAYFLLK